MKMAGRWNVGSGPGACSGTLMIPSALCATALQDAVGPHPGRTAYELGCNAKTAQLPHRSLASARLVQKCHTKIC